jgi:site-specific DNA recombinase
MGIRDASGANRTDRPKFWERRRPQHFLTGKVICGACGGAFAAVGKDYLSCTAARRQGTCSNRQSITRPTLESQILDALRDRLMQPEHVATFVQELAAEWNRLAAEASADSAVQRRELEVVERKLASLIDAISDGLRAPGLQQKLDELEHRKVTLQRVLERAPASAPLSLHPNPADVYRDRVARLPEAFNADRDGAAALEQGSRPY